MIRSLALLISVLLFVSSSLAETEPKFNVAEVNHLVNQYLFKELKGHRLSQIQQLNKAVFNLNHDDYISAIKNLESNWFLAPEQAMSLTTQLEIYWHQKHLQPKLEEQTYNIQFMSYSGLILGFSTMVGLSVKQPQKIPKLARFFRFAMPILGQKAGEYGGEWLRGPLAEQVYPSPSQIMDFSDGYELSENELNEIMDDLFAMSLGLAASGAASELKWLMNVARTGFAASTSVGRFAKQALIFSAVFYVVEKGAKFGLDKQRLQELEYNKVDGLFVLRDKVLRSINSGDNRPKEARIWAFTEKALSMGNYFSWRTVQVDQQYLVERTKLELENETSEDLDKKLFDLEATYLYKRRRSKDRTCEYRWQDYKTLSAQISSPDFASEMFSYTHPYVSKNQVRRLRRYLSKTNPNLRIPNSIKKDHWIPVIDQLKSSKQLVTSKYKVFLKRERDQLHQKWTQQIKTGRICPHREMFLLQVKIFLESLNDPTAQQAASTL